MPFPLIKIAYLAVKQISKPLANALKRKAKTSPFLRNYIVIPQAQAYHRFETTFKLRLLGLGKTQTVKPLSEEMAIDLGADMLGEMFIFGVATGIIYWDYRRAQKKDEAKEDVQNDKLGTIEKTVGEMGLLLEEQRAQIKELTRLCYAMQNGTNVNVSTNNSLDSNSKLSDDTMDRLPNRIVDKAIGAILTVEKGS